MVSRQQQRRSFVQQHLLLGLRRFGHYQQQQLSLVRSLAPSAEKWSSSSVRPSVHPPVGRKRRGKARVRTLESWQQPPPPLFVCRGGTTGPEGNERRTIERMCASEGESGYERSFVVVLLPVVRCCRRLLFLLLLLQSRHTAAGGGVRTYTDRDRASERASERVGVSKLESDRSFFLCLLPLYGRSHALTQLQEAIPTGGGSNTAAAAAAAGQGAPAASPLPSFFPLALGGKHVRLAF